MALFTYLLAIEICVCLIFEEQTCVFKQDSYKGVSPSR